MEILRAKTLDLRQTGELTPRRKENSRLNQEEALAQAIVLYAAPRRLVFEMTNRCNLNCVMCGRNAADFQPTQFRTEWLDYFEPVADLVEEVTLMGWGEPTVHPDFVHFLSWAKEKGLRKYFCTNGMRLEQLTSAIFEYHVDIVAVSLDGADSATNERIRRGSDFNRIVCSLEKINRRKSEQGIDYPYNNFVFTAMKQNLHQLPAMVRLASDIGVDEVKAVFLTAFDTVMKEQVLFYDMDHVRDVFAKAQEEAERLGVALKLPYLPGEDPAGSQPHKICYAGWRDFFLGSDGYIRPCMSTAQKLFHITKYPDFWAMWNSEEYQRHRTAVNGPGMTAHCANCYQSSFANWNRQESFLQIGKEFSPDWQNETRESHFKQKG